MGQCLGQLVVGYVFTNFENLLISTAILVCGQLDILYCSLKNIRYTAILLHENVNPNIYKLVKNSIKSAYTKCYLIAETLVYFHWKLMSTTIATNNEKTLKILIS